MIKKGLALHRLRAFSSVQIRTARALSRSRRDNLVFRTFPILFLFTSLSLTGQTGRETGRKWESTWTGTMFSSPHFACSLASRRNERRAGNGWGRTGMRGDALIELEGHFSKKKGSETTCLLRNYWVRERGDRKPEGLAFERANWSSELDHKLRPCISANLSLQWRRKCIVYEILQE